MKKLIYTVFFTLAFAPITQAKIAINPMTIEFKNEFVKSCSAEDFSPTKYQFCECLINKAFDTWNENDLVNVMMKGVQEDEVGALKMFEPFIVQCLREAK